MGGGGVFLPHQGRRKEFFNGGGGVVLNATF